MFACGHKIYDKTTFFIAEIRKKGFRDTHIPFIACIISRKQEEH